MKKINVIDLDGTLIKYDSFRTLLRLELSRINLPIFAITILRTMRILSQAKYKAWVILLLEKQRNEKYFIDFAAKICKSIDKNIMEEIGSNSDYNTSNVLISASPNIYVKHIIHKLSWEGSGSYFKEGSFNHLYGDNKLIWIKKQYPEMCHYYNFAISDSSSDLQLLKAFATYRLVKRG